VLGAATNILAAKHTPHREGYMTEKLPDVWYSRDYPVLREIARRFDSGERLVEHWPLAYDLGMQPDEVSRAAHALGRRGLIQFEEDYGGSITITAISGDAYILTGLHPTPAKRSTIQSRRCPKPPIALATKMIADACDARRTLSAASPAKS
jgi:hypothetical protein